MDIKYSFTLVEPVANMGANEVLTSVGFKSLKLKHADIQLELESIRNDLQADYTKVMEGLQKEFADQNTEEEDVSSVKKKKSKKEDVKKEDEKELYKARVDFMAFIYNLAMKSTKDKTIVPRLEKMFEQVVKEQYEENNKNSEIVLFNDGALSLGTFMGNETIQDNLSIEDWRQILAYFLLLLG
jgi:predicted nuclease with TOPRIM domain